jgi:hypothetical protein
MDPTHRITYALYDDLETNAHPDGRGEYLYDAALRMGRMPTELSRTTGPDGSDVALWQWKNPDGSNVIGNLPQWLSAQ